MEMNGHLLGIGRGHLSVAEANLRFTPESHILK